LVIVTDLSALVVPTTWVPKSSGDGVTVNITGVDGVGLGVGPGLAFGAAEAAVMVSAATAPANATAPTPASHRSGRPRGFDVMKDLGTGNLPNIENLGLTPSDYAAASRSVQ
jgi:hypothetical protein